MMADNFDLANPECKNYLTTSRWLVYTGETMESYTREGMKLLHQQIYTRLANLPVCCQRCSETEGALWQQWCITCQEWRTQLLRFRRRQNVPWEKTKSWLWSTHYECVAEVFSNLIHGKTTAPNFRDLTFLCSVWENCVFPFKIQRTVIRKLREQRNMFVHRAGTRVSDIEKQRLFSVLRNFFNDGHVKLYVDSAECEKRLKSIEADRYTDQCIRVLLQKLEETSNNEQDRLAELERQMENLERQMNTHTMYTVGICTYMVISIGIIVGYILLSSLYTYIYRNTLPTPAELTGCVDENYIYPFAQDFPQLDYISGHNDFIGRKWLIDDIQKMLEDDTSSSGLLLIADIGYGKSAITSHIICAKEGDRSRSLRDHIVGFHVCRFDVETSKNGGRFIRRLIGFLSTKSPEFGSIITHLSNASIMFSKEKCEEELDACFDQGIVFPLKKMETPGDIPWLIVIDALDECKDNTIGENKIVNILSRGIRKLPVWFKFILTSRNTSDLVRLKHITKYVLKATDTRNMNDIFLYLSEKVNDEIKIKNFMKISQGNFQFIKHFMLHYSSGILKSFPETLAEIYEVDFERHFPADASFLLSKHILEIICATTSPLTKHEVLNILQNSEGIVTEQFTDALEKLSHYVASTEHGHLVFVHQSIAEWLQSNESGRFFILIENGHQAISSFMVDLFYTNKTLDIVNLAIHVAASHNNTLTKLFGSVARQFEYDVGLLHKLVWRTDSVEVLKLLLPILKTVDALNHANVTPAFIASAQGHLDQLKLLQKHGANLNFVARHEDELYSHFGEQIDDVIALHKDVYYTGYNLLQVASKRGHLTTVEYLLTLDQTKINETNAIGLRASDLACGDGNLEILDSISKIDPSVLDKQCFYQANKYNQMHVLKYLVTKNASIDCITEDESFNSFIMLHEGAYRLPTFSIGYSGHLEICQIAQWWIAARHTPLHVSLKNNHYIAFNFMVEHFPSLLECTDIHGYTPTLYSIVTNTTDVSNPHIKTKLPQDRCVGLLERGMYTSFNSFRGETCEVGSTAAHLIAKFNRYELAVDILKHRIPLEWNTPDALLQMPIHIACVSDHYKILHILEFVNVDFIQTRTKDNLTAIQISIAHGSVMCFHTIMHIATENVLLLKDMENRSILHYSVILDFKDMSAENDYQWIRYNTIFNKILDYKYGLLFETDKDGRNVMHYALRNGHYHTLLYSKGRAKINISTLLTSPDRFNKTAFAFALSRPKDKGFSSRNLYFEDVVSGFNYRGIYAWEQGLIIVIRAFPPTFVETYVVPELCQILHLSPYITATLFQYHGNNMNRTWLQSEFIECLRFDIDPLATLVVAMYRPDILGVCGKPLAESPLHFMVYKTNVFQRLSQNYVRSFISWTFSSNITQAACNDKSGNNIFHYALKSDNPSLASALLKLGITKSAPKMKLKDTIRMLLFHQTTNLTLINVAGSVTFDDVLVKLFDLYPPHTISELDLCNNGSRELSLIHFIAASGFSRTLLYLERTYVNTDAIFLCMNHDRITPLYLAYLFKHSECVSILESKTSLTLPIRLAEAHLVFNFESGFPFSSSSLDKEFDDTFNLQYLLKKDFPNPFLCLNNKKNSHKGNIYKQLRMAQCIKHVMYHFIQKNFWEFPQWYISILKFDYIFHEINSLIIRNTFCRENIMFKSFSDCFAVHLNDYIIIDFAILRDVQSLVFINLKALHSYMLLRRHVRVIKEDFMLRAAIERLVNVGLEFLRETVVQMSVRNRNSLWRNYFFRKNNNFLLKRVNALGLQSESPYTKYEFLMYKLSSTFQTYRYLDGIGRLREYVDYRKRIINNPFGETSMYTKTSSFFKTFSYKKTVDPFSDL